MEQNGLRHSKGESRRFLVVLVFILLALLIGETIALAALCACPNRLECACAYVPTTQTAETQPPFTPNQATPSPNPMGLDPNQEDYTGAEPTQAQGGVESGIKIPGYASITIPPNTKQVEMSLLNPKGNQCYFTFEIALNSTGETLFTSKKVEPSKYIREVTLSRPLGVGEYEATLKIRCFSLTDGTEMNGADLQLTLIVK